MNSENYGTHIKHIRQKMGLTQNQVAEALGVTPVSYTHLSDFCNICDHTCSKFFS